MEVEYLDNQLPLIAIVGPTASGKTSLAIELAERFDGEIICADSRSIYKGLDIGTAKPTTEERARVPHWGLDLVEPGERYTVVDFKKYTEEKISEIRKRGHVPFLVGGTGLYADAVLFDYQFGPQHDNNIRNDMEDMSIDELHNYCMKNNIRLPENKFNKRYVIRAIEKNGAVPQRRSEPIGMSLIVGIATDREVLRTRIKHRAEQMFNDDVVNEAILLGKKYGWESEAMTGNIYPIIQEYVLGDLSLEDAKEKFATADWRLAKRQLTWMRRNSHIQWYDLPRAREYLTGVLANANEA
jgi:tRNA dimethylallyltransferase